MPCCPVVAAGQSLVLQGLSFFPVYQMDQVRILILYLQLCMHLHLHLHDLNASKCLSRNAFVPVDPAAPTVQAHSFLLGIHGVVQAGMVMVVNNAGVVGTAREPTKSHIGLWSAEQTHRLTAHTLFLAQGCSGGNRRRAMQV